MRRSLRDETGRGTKCVLVVLLLLITLTAAVTAREIVVTSTADSGSGTLRWALQTAQSGDVITFDPAIFPPDNPATIYPRSELPAISCGHLTIDASNAGVILDGSSIPGDWYNGLQVYSSNNTVMGLQILNFKGSGIAVCSANYSTIGGDRSLGSGPIGQGNLVCGNGIGIDLCDAGTHNAIVGNVIGADLTGIQPRENKCRGIWVEDGISDTQIGPNNVVAFNGCAGIVVSGPRAQRNTITQNEIYSNLGSDIDLGGGANAGMAPPHVLEFDIASGDVIGTACPYCTIEVFSGDGATYEGQVMADESGSFELRSTSPFSGPRLVVTATDREGNTSAFSAPTSGIARTLGFQQGNSLPKELLSDNLPKELADNHVGGSIGNWDPGDYSAPVYESLLASIQDLGIKWVRTNFWSPNPLNWQVVLRGPGDYYIDPDVDAFITELANEGINVVITLCHGAGLDTHEYGDGCWGDPGNGVLGQREPERWFAKPSERDAFCEYARFMVEHFRGRVSYYEIWNEPSSGDYPADCRGAISVRDYASLLKQVVPVIHAADEAARIIAGAIGRFNERERDWLLELLRLGIGSLVDGLSWHPFYGASPGQGTDGPRYWEEYPSAVLGFMDEAHALGFTGEYYVDEMVWRTLTDYVPSELPLYTDTEAAKYAARAITLHAGLGFKEAGTQLLMPGVIKLVPRYYVVRNLSNCLAGTSATGMPVEIDTETEGPVAYCAFRYPDGDRMLAVWTDGIAQDEDPGIPATTTFPGLTAETVTGIDVLHGFEQELVFETDGGSTIIRDLLVKDYPILIRLSDVTMSADYEETAGDGYHQLGDVDAIPSSTSGSDRDGDGVPDDKD